jgi:hypothetical protein
MIMSGTGQNDRVRELHRELETSGCTAVYSRLIRFTQSQRIFLGNYAELELAIANHNSVTPFIDHYDVDGQTMLKNHIFEFMRQLHNTVAAALSLRDHTICFYRKFYQDANRIPDYAAQIASRFAKHGLTQFVLHLRQYCQHYRNVSVVSTLFLDNEHGRHRRTISLSKDDLMEFGSWNATARQYLTELPDRIDILILLQAYRDHIIDFYNWFYGRLKEIHHEELATYHRIMDEIDRHRPPRRLGKPKPM